jgi:hypothetical protein
MATVSLNGTGFTECSAETLPDDRSAAPESALRAAKPRARSHQWSTRNGGQSIPVATLNSVAWSAAQIQR